MVMNIRKTVSTNLLKAAIGVSSLLVSAKSAFGLNASAKIESSDLGFDPNNLGIGGLLTFIIRLVFVAAGLAALIFMLLGALSWITSGGNKENVEKAREKIQAAVVGIVLVVVVVGIAVTIEQLIFKNQICLGLTCEVTVPGLLK